MVTIMALAGFDDTKQDVFHAREVRSIAGENLLEQWQQFRSLRTCAFCFTEKIDLVRVQLVAGVVFAWMLFRTELRKESADVFFGIFPDDRGVSIRVIAFVELVERSLIQHHVFEHRISCDVCLPVYVWVATMTEELRATSACGQ